MVIQDCHPIAGETRKDTLKAFVGGENIDGDVLFIVVACYNTPWTFEGFVIDDFDLTNSEERCFCPIDIKFRCLHTRGATLE